MKTKVISLVLVVVMCLTLSVPAFATDVNTNDGMDFKSEDLSNGDARFYYEKDGQITVEVYVDRATNTVTRTDYVTGEVTSYVCEPANTQQLNNISNSVNEIRYTHLGRINYNYYSPTSDVPQGTHSLNCDYYRTYDTDAPFNVNGRYQDMITFVGFLASIFSLPAAIAGVVAAEVASYVGVAIGAGAMLIPPCLVNCERTTVSWNLNDNNVPSLYAIMAGSRYVYSIDGNQHTQYDGDYWPAVSYGNRDYNFAYHIYTLVYGQGRCGVTSWS